MVRPAWAEVERVKAVRGLAVVALEMAEWVVAALAMARATVAAEGRAAGLAWAQSAVVAQVAVELAVEVHF